MSLTTAEHQSQDLGPMDKAVHQLVALSSLAETQGVGSDRENWRQRRRRMVAAEEKHTPRAVKERRHWVAFRWLLALFGVGLQLFGLYVRIPTQSGH